MKMEQNTPNKHKFSITENQQNQPIQPSLKAKIQVEPNQQPDVYTSSGVSLNDILNKGRRRTQEAEDLGYAATIMNQIKQEHQARSKKAKIIFLSVVGALFLIFIVLLFVFPDLVNIFEIK